MTVWIALVVAIAALLVWRVRIIRKRVESAEPLFGPPTVVERDATLAVEFGRITIPTRILCRVTASICESPRNCTALGCTRARANREQRKAQ